MESARIPDGYAVVACGTLRPELRHLAQAGALDEGRLFFTAPGLHEWPARLKEQLARQLDKARCAAERVIVVYGETCHLDVETGADTDALLAEFAPDVARVSARNCVDMLAGQSEREHYAGSKKVYWLTPGWIEYWDFIFKDWDGAKANETFPAHDTAILLDAVDYYESLSQTDPEKILRIADWMGIQLVPQPISLERLKTLLLQSVERLGTGP